MMKKILIAASLLSPLAIFAQESVPAANPATNAPKQARSISLLCQQQAALKKLAGTERKQFLVTCINPDAKPAPAPAN
jgi:hypothetical protein